MSIGLATFTGVYIITSLYLWKFHRKPVAPPLLYLASLLPPPPPPPSLKHTTGGSLLSMLTTQNTLINMKEVTN